MRVRDPSPPPSLPSSPSQACEGLPETGTTYGAVWERLLPGGEGPESLVDLSGSAADLSRSGRVWLIGEGRWENEG